MHIGDGIVEIGAIAVGYAVTAAATAYSIYKINQSDDPRAEVPKAALLTAAFFIASSIRFPIPPVTVHLVLNGLLGVMLGWYAFPAILIGLILQAFLVGHGGLSTLGVNALIMGVPALLSHAVFQFVRLRKDNLALVSGLSFVGGALGVLLAVGLFAGITLTNLSAEVNVEAERLLIRGFTIAHIPIALLEGLLTMFIVTFLLRVMPKMVPYAQLSLAAKQPTRRTVAPPPVRKPQQTRSPSFFKRLSSIGKHDHEHGHAIDEFAHLNSPIHVWDSRFKLVAILLLIMTFAFVSNLWLLVPMVIVSDMIFATSGMPRRFLNSRLEVPGYFILAIVVLLPFLSGQTLVAEFGPVQIFREGISAAVLIAVRFYAIMTLALTLFGTDTFLRSVKAMRALRFPAVMADMVLLTYRYIFEVGAYFGRTRTAARLRGFQSNRLSRYAISTQASLLGHMLVRSYEQSDRVYKAMILRGYGAAAVNRNEFTASSADFVKTGLVIAIAIAFVVAQLVL